MHYRKSFIILFISHFASFCLFSCVKEHGNINSKPEPETELLEIFKANRILIRHGLQIQCWVATDNIKLGQEAGQPAFKMLASDWVQTGFTGPTFYGPPLCNLSFFEDFPENQWSIAKAPHADQLKKAPTDNEKKNGFLTPDQKKYLSNLISICFGDEEHYSPDVVNNLKEWYKVARRYYPDVLLHNNQYAGQWNENELRNYLRNAKPDLLVYDWYYFDNKKSSAYKGAKDMADHLMMYRNLALEGPDGLSKEYLTFGQYIQGFAIDGIYRLTESQLCLYYYMTWTFGGKWLNWFRYLQGNEYNENTSPTEWALLLENGMPGKPSKYMQWVNKCNRESKFMSSYLVRLKTKDVRYISGDETYKEGRPSRVNNFQPDLSFVKNIKAELISEPDKKADLYIGFFDIIPKEEKGEPDFFSHPDVKCFMITNAFTSPLYETAESLSQKITISVDMSVAKEKKLFSINTDNGNKEELKSTEETDNYISLFETTLRGGSGRLFILE